MNSNLLKWIRRFTIAFYGMLWVGGVSCYMVLGGPPDHTAWTAPTFLWVAALLVYMSVSCRERAVLLICALAGYLVEVSGVYTGFPFGGYSYTGVLYPLLFNTPVVMGAAWLLLLGYTRHLTVSLPFSRTATAALGAGWMVLIDLVIDPLAAGPLGYWRWDHPHGYYGVPWSNFAGWWVTAFVLLRFYPEPSSKAKDVLWTGFSTVVFFTILAFTHRFWIPALAGLLLVSVHLFRKRIPEGRKPG